MKFSFGLLSLFFFANYVSGQSTVCDDAYECEDDTISNTYVYCYGYFGCDSADISASYHYNYGYLASYYADVYTSYSYSYGLYSGYYEDIQVYGLYAYGFYSQIYSDIQPYSTSFLGYFYGFYSGYYADILCYSGDTCKVYCGSSYGCYGMKFYCYSGATCYYNCDSDSTCPTLYSGVESTLLTTKETNTMINSDTYTHYSGLSDDEITQYYNENKEIKMHMIEDDHKSGLLDDIKLKLQDNDAMDEKQMEELAKSFDVAPINHAGPKRFKFDDKLLFAVIGLVSGILVTMIGSKMIKKWKNNNKNVEYTPLTNYNSVNVA